METIESLRAEVDRLRADRNTEKQMRKDADSLREDALDVLREVYDRLTRTDTDGLGWHNDNPLPARIAAILDGMVVDTRRAAVEDERDALKAEVEAERQLRMTAQAHAEEDCERLRARIATLEAAILLHLQSNERSDMKGYDCPGGTGDALRKALEDKA